MIIETGVEAAEVSSYEKGWMEEGYFMIIETGVDAAGVSSYEKVGWRKDIL